MLTQAPAPATDPTTPPDTGAGGGPATASSTGTVATAPGTGTVVVVGLGYVGLPTAVSLAEAGARVSGYDIAADRLATIRAGRADLLPTDQERLALHLTDGTIELTADPATLAAADAVIVCVPTPVDDHLVPDLEPLRRACATVVEHAVAGQTILLTSTTYVGCTRDLLTAPLAERGFTVGVDVHVAFSPERIDPGVVAHRPETTARVVGAVTAEGRHRAVALLTRISPLVHEVTSPEAAELTKLLENSFRAVNIAFANEFADVVKELGVDPIEVIDAAATKPYGFLPFYPGPGVGGHCIPTDPHYLLWQLTGRQRMPALLRTAMAEISERPRRIAARARETLAHWGKPVVGARVLVVGVAYKPDVADARETPAVPIIDALRRMGANVAYTDPFIDRLRVFDGELRSLTDPGTHPWDLVIVHTAHTGADLSWLQGQPAVLDTTFKLTGLPRKETP